MEIKTDNTHKSAARVEFAKTVKTKVTTVLTIGSAVLIMFSGCKSLANDKNVTIQTPSTTAADKLKETDTSKKENTTIKIEETTETSFRESIKVNETTQVETQNLNSVNSYDKMLKNLETQLDKKQFGKEETRVIIDIFNKLYENYNSWTNIYKDLPKMEDFIEDKLIKTIEYIEEFNIYEANSKEANKLYEQYGATNFTTQDQKVNITKEEGVDTSIIAFHEISHAEQNAEENASSDKENYYYSGVDLSRVLREGEATFNMKFLTKPSTEKISFDFIDGNDETIEYGKSFQGGYAKYLYIYENLNFFAGYKDLNLVQGENIPLQIEKALSEKYGDKLAKEILDNISNWTKMQNSYDNTDSYEAAINLQQVFMKCIEKDIEKLDSASSVLNYMNIYRAYKLNILPQVINSDGVNVTGEIFNTDELDEKMISKILEFKAVPEFSQNKALNRMALKALLLASNEPFYDSEGIYQDIYLPNDINGIKYKYYEEDGVGSIVFDYKNTRNSDNSAESVQLQISFTESEILRIQESSIRQYGLYSLGGKPEQAER